MWLFLVNGVVWVMYNMLTRHGRETTLFRKRDVAGVLPMINYYLRRGPHPETGKYNALQKSAYSVLPLVGLLAVLSGIAIYWPVQAQWLTAIFGDYDAARIWHFGAMVALVLFFLSHIVLVTLAGWKNFTGMITGKGEEQHVEEQPGALHTDGLVESAS
jgi:thiosulfate reductase cytochrome b subunit